MTQAVLGPNYRLKRRRVAEYDPNSEDSEVPNRRQMHIWVPPSHLGPPQAWIKERDNLAMTAFSNQSEDTAPKRKERAEELLHMIEAIGCEDVMAAWDQAIAQERSLRGLRSSLTSNSAQAICRFIERSQVKSFKDKVLLRIGKLLFTIRISQDVGNIRDAAALSRQKGNTTPANGKGHAIYQAIEKFLAQAYPELRPEEREKKHSRYRELWYEGQIWFRMNRVFGCSILLLIPDGHCSKGGRSISNKK